MIEHLQQIASNPRRVVILGAKGFVGSSSSQCLQKNNISMLPLSREQIDFCSDNAKNQIARLLNPEDAVVIAVAKAPCKNNAMLLDNILMMKNICAALKQQPISQLIYISSDAVYADSDEPLTEASVTAPTSLHGMMHLVREYMLASVIEKEKLLFLRPTLIYGANDPHNGYGPNQFYRFVSEGKPIFLFGQGEEQRDHVYIEDVAEIIKCCLQKRSYGILNVVSGQSITFFEIAKKINQLFDVSVEIKHLPRKGPMPHNGYRVFNNTLCQNKFPGFKYCHFYEGIEKLHRKMKATSVLKESF